MKLVDRLDSVAKRIERFLSGRPTADPLYLSNRTIGQKIRLGLLIGTPAVAIIALVLFGVNSYVDPSEGSDRSAAFSEDPARALTAKVLPNIEKNFTTDYSRDVDIIEATVSTGNDHTLSGHIRNNTDRVIQVVDMIFDVNNGDGSELGGVAVTVRNVAPKATVPFKTTLPQPNARAVMVRQLHSR